MEWLLAAEVDEITPGKVKLITIDNKEIGIFYERSTYFAVLNVCPHNKAEVCRGRVTGTLLSPGVNEYELCDESLVLRCPWHRWEFSLDTGRSTIPDVKERIKTYPVKVEDGGIFVGV